MNRVRILNNAKWIVVCKVLQSMLQLLIGMISARYLGPSNYGLIGYAASLVAFAVPFMQLGMSETLVREYVSAPEKEGEILGTALLMNLLSSIACMIGVAFFVAVANAGERETIVVCMLHSVTLFFQAFELIKYRFEAKLLAKYSSAAMLAAHTVACMYKIYLLVTSKSVYWFALSHGVEYCAVGMILLRVYFRQSKRKLRVSFSCAKAMFSRSRYYIFASLMVTVFQNTDRVMLKLMVGDAENGFYTAAITCTIIVSFVYSAVIDSARPVILQSKQQSQERFERNVSTLYTIVLYMAALQTIVFAIFAKPIVSILYGQAYLPVVSVLRIIIWQLAFSYMGLVRNIWILAEEKYSVLWGINLAGVIVNVLMNGLFIPRWGACGAAFASVLTQLFTNFILGFILEPIRTNNRLMLEGLKPKRVFSLLLMLKK